MAAAVEKAYLTIREGIIRGRFPPGSHLTAQDLAAGSGLSRTPIREAMRRLHAEGLVEFIPNRGAFVKRVGENEINDIYALRVTLEGYAAEAAARKRTRAQLDRLRDLSQEMRDLIERDRPAVREKVAELNNEFHRLIVTASHNSRLSSALSAVIEMPLVLRTFRRYNHSELRRSNNQHEELVAALKAGDGVWARSVMTGHILSAQHTLLDTLSQGKDGLADAEFDETRHESAKEASR